MAIARRSSGVEQSKEKAKARTVQVAKGGFGLVCFWGYSPGLSGGRYGKKTILLVFGGIWGVWFFGVT